MKQRRRAADDARGLAAGDVALDPGQYLGVGSILVEACEVETELARIRAQVVVLERLLAVVQQVVHLPEAILTGRRLGRRRTPRAHAGGSRVSGKWRKAKRTRPGSSRSTCSIARNACREYGHS